MQQTNMFPIQPRVKLLSKLHEDELKFTLSGVNVSFANAIRRIILSDIPIVVFRVSPNTQNKCMILMNTCGLNNEIVKHRLSCIPIHIKDIEDFPIQKYVMELNVTNDTDTTRIVTTQDFTIKNIETGEWLPEDKTREIFPPNSLTGDFIDFVRLRAKPSDELKGKTIHLVSEFDIGTAAEDGAYNVVSACSYGNTVDTGNQEAKLLQLRQKWKDEGKTADEIEFEAANWKLLEGKRIFVKDSFDFTIQTIGIHTNEELLVLACKIMIRKLENLEEEIDRPEFEIKNSDTTIPNCFDVILNDQDYTVGKVIEYFILTNYFEKGVVTFCGFTIMHPHDGFGVLRIAYKDPVDISHIHTNLKECISHSKQVYQQLSKEFLKLVDK